MSGSSSLEKDRSLGMSRDKDKDDMRKMGSGPPSRESSKSRYIQSGHSPAGSLSSRMDYSNKPDNSSSRGNDNPLDNREAAESRVPSSKSEEMSEEKAELMSETVFSEWCENNSMEDTLKTIHETFVGRHNQTLLIKCILNKVIDGKRAARLRFGELLVGILKEKKIITSNDVVEVFGQLIEISDDLIVDIPFFWSFIAEVIGPLVVNEVFTFDELKTLLKDQSPKNTAKVLAEVLKHLTENHKTNIWSASKAVLTDFVDASEVDDFCKNNSFWFLSSSSPIDVEVVELRKTLIGILSSPSENAFDDASTFLFKIQNSVSKKEFIEIASVAVIVASMNQHGKLVANLLNKHDKLIQKYVDNNEELELYCLTAIKNYVINEAASELSVLKESFAILYDDNIISTDAFNKWKIAVTSASQDSAGGLLAVKSLAPFYVALAEADDDDEVS